MVGGRVLLVGGEIRSSGIRKAFASWTPAAACERSASGFAEDRAKDPVASSPAQTPSKGAEASGLGSGRFRGQKAALCCRVVQ